MYLLLNGSFGIGKTTVATLIEREVPGADIYDPERLGFILRRVPPFLLGLRSLPPDYQDLALWRNLITAGAQRKHRRSPVVIIPMAFTNLGYLDVLATSLSTSGRVVRLCLVATAEVIADRLESRARREGRAVTEFERRRSGECIAAHGNRAFGAPIDANRTPAEIVADIRKQAAI